jgi:Lipocalin-like domain
LVVFGLSGRCPRCALRLDFEVPVFGLYITLIGQGHRKFASNNRLQGTPEENEAAVHSSIAYFGTYTVSEADHTLNFHIDRCTFPNWDGTDQKRSVTITGDEMKYSNAAASGGGKAELVWKREK